MESSRFQLYRGLPREIYLLFAARIVNTIGSFVTPLIAMILTIKIGMTSSQTGLFSTMMMITQVPCLIFGGRFVDTFGRKNTILIFQTLGAISYMVCAFIRPSLLMAILILIAIDLYAFALPAFDSMTADLTTGTARNNAFSLLYLGSNIGFTIGPLFSGMLFNHYLALLFLLDGLTTFLSTVLILLIPETKKSCSLPTGAEDAEENIVTEKSNTLRLLWRYPVLLIFLLVTIFYDFTYAQYGFTLPLQMDDFFKSAGPQLYSTLIMANGIIVIIFTPLFTKWAIRFRSLQSITYGGFLFFLSYVLFSFSKGLFVFYIAIILFTFGEIITTINTGVFIADHTPSTHRGRVNSAASLIRGTGFALGPVVMGNLLQKTSYFISWIIIAVLMLIGAVLMFALDLDVKKRKIASNDQNVEEYVQGNP